MGVDDVVEAFDKAIQLKNPLLYLCMFSPIRIDYDKADLLGLR